MNRLNNSKDSKYDNYVIISVLCVCFIVSGLLLV